MGKIETTLLLGAKPIEIDSQQRNVCETNKSIRQTGSSQLIHFENARYLGTDIFQAIECSKLLEKCRWESLKNSEWAR